MESKNIKDYLHLYICCDCLYDNGVSVRRHIVPDVLSRVYSEFATATPILRPLSSMTEDEKVRLFKLSFGEEHNFDMFGFDPVEQIILADKNGRTRAAVSLKSMSVEGILFLLSKGFDLFGLIDAGLAIKSE